MAEVESERSVETQGVLRDWLRTTELEPSTRKTYKLYIREYIEPALGGEPMAKIKPRVLEELYTEMRRCRNRCDGTDFVEHRTDEPHECRTVQHKRPPGRPRQADTRSMTAPRRAARSSSVGRYQAVVAELGVLSSADAYLLPYEPTGDRPYNKDWVTHRYTAMCRQLGIESHLHACATTLPPGCSPPASTCARSPATAAEAPPRTGHARSGGAATAAVTCVGRASVRDGVD